MKPGMPAPAGHYRAYPYCHATAYRIQRRFVDLLLGVFGPVQRYRCTAMGCGWEGNLRLARQGQGEVKAVQPP